MLKPGARYVSYEWVTTKLYDPNNADHVAIIDEINWGNGLPVWGEGLRMGAVTCGGQGANKGRAVERR